VGQHRELLRRVERDEITGPRPARHEGPPPGHCEDALDEILAERRVTEAAFLLDRQHGKACGQHPCVGAGAVAADHASRIVDAHAEEPARGRPAFEHVAVQVQRFELPCSRSRVTLHARGQVFAGRLDDQPRGRRVTDEPDRVARDAEPDLDLGAHRHPLDERAERVDQEAIALVAAVVANLLAEEAGGDAEPDLLGLAFAHSVH
jgi:hypothetical protein